MSSTVQKTFLGHPVGLFILFFTEMWERFSYYGMRAILVLYLTTSVTEKNPGLGWSSVDALALYGWYTMLVYVMSIPGGILADKFIGQRRSVMVGGLLLVAGHTILAVEQMWAFYLGLSLIILGVGGLKPNISTMVGGLYREGDIRRDKGFTIFYIGINIGAAASSILVGYIGENYGWHYGFGLAGIGMAIGQVIFMYGQRYLKGIGEPPSKKDRENADDSIGRLLRKLFRERFPLIVFIIIQLFGAYLILAQVFNISSFSSIGYGILASFVGLVVGLMMVIYNELNSVEKDRYVVLLLSFIIVIVFWGAFEQAGGLMNLYTKEKVNRVIEIASWSWEIPASVFQSVNAIFIIIFGTLVANFWAKRKLKGGESSSLFKMAVGTIVMGVGFLFMAKASLEVLSTGEAALVWIILAYLFHTLGELSASPVALSFITKLAPVKYVSIMMGVYFAATGFGNKLAGAIGEASQTEPVSVSINATPEQLKPYIAQDSLEMARMFNLSGIAYFDQEALIMKTDEGDDVFQLIEVKNRAKLEEVVASENPNALDEAVHFTIVFENSEDDAQVKSDSTYTARLENYSGEVDIFEVSNKRELRTFLFITLFTALFGLLLIIFLKKLKKLTHGAEEAERDLD